MKIFEDRIKLTNVFVDYMRKLDEKYDSINHKSYAAIVASCKVGWSMGQLFPFEVGKVKYEELHDFDEMEKISSKNIPNDIEIYVEKDVIEDLPENIIIDFIEMNNTKLAFIPAIPNLIDKYEFFEDEGIKNKISKWTFEINYMLNSSNAMPVAIGFYFWLFHTLYFI